MAGAGWRWGLAVAQAGDGSVLSFQSHCVAGRGEPCAHFWGALFFQGSAGLSSSGGARSPLSAMAAFCFKARLVFHRSALFSRLGWVFLAAMAASRLHSAPLLFFQGSAGLAWRPKACARLPPASAAKSLAALTPSHRQPPRPQALSTPPPNGFPRCRCPPPNGFLSCRQTAFCAAANARPTVFRARCVARLTAFRAACDTDDGTLSDTANDTANDTALSRFPKGLQPIRDTINDTRSGTIFGTNRGTLFKKE